MRGGVLFLTPPRIVYSENKSVDYQISSGFSGLSYTSFGQYSM